LRELDPGIEKARGRLRSLCSVVVVVEADLKRAPELALLAWPGLVLMPRG
jgi:hypothetical protein